MLIFDVDGVLVDVRGSFHRTILDTVHYFTGRRVTYFRPIGLLRSASARPTRK
jgi:phosphoglycolate phosphatase-like HAD superfamily hydrolase